MMRALLFAAVVLLTPSAAKAACTTIAITSPLTFGTYDGNATDSSATITVNCTVGFPFAITMDAGSSGSTEARTMKSGTTALKYGMFQDAAHTSNWGNANGVDTVTGIGTGANQMYTVYGRVPVGQLIAPGSYVDGPLNAAVLAGPVAPLSVIATIVPSCTITATGLSFPTYAGSIVASTGSITVVCSNTTPYNLGLSAGAGSAATASTRAMTLGTNTIPYSLYQDSAMTVNWGTTIGIDEQGGTGNGIAQTFTVYGRIASGFFPQPGTYTDTIVATVTY